MLFNQNNNGCKKKEKIKRRTKKRTIKNEILEDLKQKYPLELTKNQCLRILFEKGISCTVGTFYNAVSELKKKNLIVSERRFETYYSWNNSKSENNPKGVESHILSEDGFVKNVLELAKANGFESVCRVHDIHLVTNFWKPENFSARLKKTNVVWRHEHRYSWKSNSRAKSWVIKLLICNYYRVTFQFYECGRLTCIIKCFKKAIPPNLSGLRSIERIITEACLIVFDESKFWSFPQPDKWIVSQWHYGRDSEAFFDSRFGATFKTFFRGLARIYVREADGRLRLEEIQDPRKALGVLKEEAKDKDFPNS